MSYPSAVKGIEIRTQQERRIINEENLIKLIRLIILPLCLLFWYGIYRCCQLLHHWIFS